MSIPELLWRLSQKRIQVQEKNRFGKNKFAVSKTVFNTRLSALKIFGKDLHINFKNTDFTLDKSIFLLAGAEYSKYINKWNAGFQTENVWPDIFSYKLKYKQRDDIGDARTNWELNRHFQLALLAKNYAASGKEKYLSEFKKLFSDWNKKNPFLHGIAWTSVMEVAIRCSNWCYAYAFLEYCSVTEELLNQLRIGILNMTDYVCKHYSRYSSANNHLIVEAYAIGQSGILFHYKEWIELSLSILSRELPIQNYSDGVNKEHSLHYQSFYMEAMGLMMRLLIKNGVEVPSTWSPALDKMSKYIADCTGNYGEIVVFGDDDEGKILDLQGGKINHYQYVLGIMSILLGKRYVESFECETLKWLFKSDEIEKINGEKPYLSPQYCCYKEGGYSILRSNDRKILIGIDHAELGFGSIAAHGHADALSFQLFYEGQSVFVDPGTYIYHCDSKNRNAFRKTANHNTVCIEGQDQSEMLGAFLWGKKAECKLVESVIDQYKVRIVANHTGYTPEIHTRTFEFNGVNEFKITDSFLTDKLKCINFTLSPYADIQISNNKVKMCLKRCEITIRFYCKSKVDCTCLTGKFSKQYGIMEETSLISVLTTDKKIKTIITISMKHRKATNESKKEP